MYTENVDQKSPSREILQRLPDSQRQGRVSDNNFSDLNEVKSCTDIYVFRVFLKRFFFYVFLLFYLSFTLYSKEPQ